jgi:hypothetical protein
MAAVVVVVVVVVVLLLLRQDCYNLRARQHMLPMSPRQRRALKMAMRTQMQPILRFLQRQEQLLQCTHVQTKRRRRGRLCRQQQVSA